MCCCDVTQPILMRRQAPPPHPSGLDGKLAAAPGDTFPRFMIHVCFCPPQQKVTEAAAAAHLVSQTSCPPQRKVVNMDPPRAPCFMHINIQLTCFYLYSCCCCCCPNMCTFIQLIDLNRVQSSSYSLNITDYLQSAGGKTA